ncbi:cell division protein ZapA [uncultured Erythrobacter sp.]|uniref:cell division protein ZapA n=1 Tax=uncultured Erythrobacter sp. TaxID=263913 RepID=UPI0026175741|nr:cell division protein ZapA [uncultured Erythrobacter sp.]
MSEVTIKVGPKPYTIVCGEGEEEKIAALGKLIDEKYAQLGNSRAVQETHNLVFAALFMADELDEARRTAAGAEKAVEEAQKTATEANKRAADATENAQAKFGDKGSELQAQIDTLRKAEERAREEATALKAELAEMREAARHQHDLFGDEKQEEVLAKKLEALAARAEQTAAAMESAA